MLRINLLPQYVSQRRLTRKLLAGFCVLLILCIAVPLVLYTSQAQAAKDMQAKAQQAEDAKKITDDLKTQASNQRSQIAPLKAKVDFVTAVKKHTNDIVAFWNTVAKYSDPRVTYSEAAVSGTTLQIKAYAPSIAEVSRYLLIVYNEPDFSSVAIDRLPGYPEALVNKYYLDGQLVATGPSSGGAGGMGGAMMGGPGMMGGGGFRGAMGGPPMMGGGMRGGPMMGGGMMGAGMMGGGPPMMGGGFGGMRGGVGGGATGPSYGSEAPIGGSGTASAVPVVQESAGTNGTPGRASMAALYTALSSNPRFASLFGGVSNPFADPSAREAAIVSVLRRVKVKTEAQGFGITVTAALKQPLMAPTVPGAGGGTGGGMAGGMPGMMGPMGPGGMPGGPPGMAGPPPGMMPAGKGA